MTLYIAQTHIAWSLSAE